MEDEAKIEINGCSFVYWLSSPEIPAYSFLCEMNEKRALLTIDHSKNLIKDYEKRKLKNLDLLIINMGSFETVAEDETCFLDNIKVVNLLKPKTTYLVHIEEFYKITPKKVEELEKFYENENLKFAHDFQIINV